MTTDLFTESSAVISDCGKYRYLLTRRWDAGNPVTFVMLNPSTADADKDDPTIRRCIRFARDWGFGALQVVNLFAVRAADPRVMMAEPDPVGPDNHEHCIAAFDRARNQWMYDYPAAPAICAWGVHGRYMDQDQTMLGWMQSEAVTPMALYRDGAPPKPNHPLYLPACLRPKPLEPVADET